MGRLREYLRGAATVLDLSGGSRSRGLGEEERLALLTKAAVRYLDLTRHGEDLDYMGDPERARVERAAHGS